MSVTIPSQFGMRITGGPIGPIGPMTVAVTSLPKLTAGLDPLQVNLGRVQVALERLQVGLEPMTVHVGLAEVPRIRVHLPAHYSVGLRVMGVELVCLSLCGEAQLITEPYEPGLAEDCHGKRGKAEPVGETAAAPVGVVVMPRAPVKQ